MSENANSLWGSLFIKILMAKILQYALIWWINKKFREV